MSPAQLDGAGPYTPLPAGSTRPCAHCGSPARYVRTPTSVEDAVADRERLCERCYRQTAGNEGGDPTPLNDPATWNPPEGDGSADAPEPLPAIYRTPPEPDLPDLPQPDAVAGLDDEEVGRWVDRLCAAEIVRSPGTRYAVGLPPATIRATLQTDLGDDHVRLGYDQYCAARRAAWERECRVPHYEGEHRRPALAAEAFRLASAGYDVGTIYLSLLQFNHDRLIPPLYEVPPGPDGEVQELRQLAEQTYNELPLSALRVEGIPNTLDYAIGPQAFVRNDRTRRKITGWTTVRDRETGEERWIQTSVILNVAVEELAVRVSPRGAVTRFEVLFVGLPRTQLRVVGTLNEVLGRLQEEGLVVNELVLKRGLPGLVQTMRERYLCQQTDEEYLPGFYPARYRDVETQEVALEDGLSSVDRQTPALTRTGLRAALEGLNTLVERWFSYSDEARARIATVVKWGLIAPFGFIRKHVGIPSDYLILLGNSQTGKSAAGQLVLAMWGRNNPNHRIQYGAFNSEARAGEQMARFTYPLVVDEMDLSNENLSSLLKNSWESLISREPLTVTRQRQPREALAPVILTSNTDAPVGDGMRNRSAILNYNLRDRDWTLRHATEFRDEGLPLLEQLPFVGAYAWAVVQQTPALLEERSWLTLGTATLEGAYRYAGLAVPTWVYDAYDYSTDTAVEARIAVALALRDYVVRTFSQEFPRYRALFSNESSWEDQLWDMPKKLDLLLATGSLAPIHPVRGRGVRVPAGVEAAVAAADNIEAVRIDAGLFSVPEFQNSHEVKQNLHADLENLAKVLGVDRPAYANVPTPDGRRSRRIALTIPKSLLINLIESVAGAT